MKRLTLSRGEMLALLTTLLGFLHHVDHVLRFDHSGWPFRAEVTPFTYSLLVYPVVAALLLARDRLLLRAVLAFFLFLVPTLAHVFIETPVHQFNTWAHKPGVNLLDARSPVAGATAALVTILLSVSAFLTFLAFWREHRRHEKGAP